jgi:hypothetical protein
LEIHLKKWKSFLILVQLGLGFSLRNALTTIAQHKTRNTSKQNQKNSKIIPKLLNSFNTVKERFLVTQLRIELASVELKNIA